MNTVNKLKCIKYKRNGPNFTIMSTCSLKYLSFSTSACNQVQFFKLIKNPSQSFIFNVSVEEDSGGEEQEHVPVEENEDLVTRGEEPELFDEISVTEEEKKEIPMTRIAITTLMQQPKVRV